MFPALGSYSKLILTLISPYTPHLPYLNTPLTRTPHPHLPQEPHSRSVPANQTSGSPAGVMGVGASVWCKHAAADKQIMLSLCCHGWQRTQRGAGALPGRRVHPFSQGGGEGEHEGRVAWRGGLVLIEPGSQTPPPLLAGMHTAPVGGEGEERRRRKQADIKRGSKKRKKRASEGK